MKRLQGQTQILYDANIIVYYSFFVQISSDRIRILELTNKTRNLTHNLIQNNSKIVTIKMVMDELHKKTIAQIVKEYLKNPHQLVGLPRKGRNRPAFALQLAQKIEKNIDDLESKSWFEVKNYTPDDNDMKNVKNFFYSLKNNSKMIKLMKKKNKKIPVPSYVDCALICCSLSTNTILLSNDYDITCFKDKLKKNNLCHEIIDLPSIKIIQN